MKTKNICWLLAIWATLVTACAEKDELQSVKGTPVEVTCSLQIACIGGEESTRATDLTTEESTIQDLTVIQFDGAEDDARSMIVRTFQNPSFQEGFKIGLMQPQDKEKQQTLYFIANASKTFSSFNGTLGTFKATTVASADMGGKILMTGSCQTVIKTETKVNATLSSRLAKIVFNLDLTQLPSGAKFEPLWLQLRSVPLAACPEAPESGTAYPAGNSNLYTDLEPVTNDIGTNTWYIPENRRGTGSQTENRPKDKNTYKPDSYCTCIYLEANYYPSADKNTGAKRVYYTLYPGVNNTNDFNIEGNLPYNVTLKITSMPEDNSDSRLKVEPIPASRPGANCYMVQPNSFFTFNPHEPPGNDVDNIGITYLGRLGTGQGDDCNIHHVGLVWQTDPELIRAIYHLKTNGEVRIQTGEMQGNALIAAYDTNKNILWSWHIWVTDYVLDGVDEKIKNVTTDQGIDLTGDGKSRVFMWKSYVWMDRGIGAKTATPGVDSYSMMFQWGRKDPFTPASETASANSVATKVIPTYEANGNRIYPSGEQYKDNGYIFDKAMNNPTVFFASTNSSQVDWYGAPSNVALWKYPEKTCFDPCPAGWCIPPAAAIENVNAENTTIVYSSSNRELNRVYANSVTDLFWPYIGYRGQTTGEGKGAGNSGIYWTTDYYTSSKPRIYGGFTDKYNYSDGQQWRYSRDGLSARCVKIKQSTN